jgi:hypothetical protein
MQLFSLCIGWSTVDVAQENGFDKTIAICDLSVDVFNQLR